MAEIIFFFFFNWGKVLSRKYKQVILIEIEVDKKTVEKGKK